MTWNDIKAIIDKMEPGQASASATIFDSNNGEFCLITGKAVAEEDLLDTNQPYMNVYL